MPTATVTSKGQVTVPRQIREVLRIGPGDRIDFVVSAGGEVVVRAATVDVSMLKGLLKRPGRKPVSLREMEEAIGTGRR